MPNTEHTQLGPKNGALLTAKNDLQARIVDRIEDLDVDAMVKTIASDTLKEVRSVARALMGIDDTWSTPRMNHEGMIQDEIKVQVKELVTDVLAPKILAAAERQLKLKGTDKLIQAYIESAITTQISDRFNSYRDTDLTKAIDVYIMKSLDDALKHP